MIRTKWAFENSDVDGIGDATPPVLQELVNDLSENAVTIPDDSREERELLAIKELEERLNSDEDISPSSLRVAFAAAGIPAGKVAVEDLPQVMLKPYALEHLGNEIKDRAVAAWKWLLAMLKKFLVWLRGTKEDRERKQLEALLKNTLEKRNKRREHQGPVASIYDNFENKTFQSKGVCRLMVDGTFYYDSMHDAVSGYGEIFVVCEVLASKYIKLISDEAKFAQGVKEVEEIFRQILDGISFATNASRGTKYTGLDTYYITLGDHQFGIDGSGTLAFDIAPPKVVTANVADAARFIDNEIDFISRSLDVMDKQTDEAINTTKKLISMIEGIPDKLTAHQQFAISRTKDLVAYIGGIRNMTRVTVADTIVLFSEVEKELN